MLHTPNFFIVVCLYIQKKIQELKKRIQHFLCDQSGLTLLEMAVVLIIIGIFLAGTIPQIRKTLNTANLEKTYSEIELYRLAVGHFLENSTEAETQTDSGKKIWSILKKNKFLPTNQKLFTTQDGFEYLKLSNGAHLIIKIQNDAYPAWYMLAGPMGLNDAIKIYEKMESSEIYAKDAVLVDNIPNALQTHSPSEKYDIKIPI